MLHWGGLVLENNWNRNIIY